MFVLLGWFIRWEVSGCTSVVLWCTASMICSKQYVVFLCNSHLAFSQRVSFESRWGIHIVVPTLLQVTINTGNLHALIWYQLFYQIQIIFNQNYFTHRTLTSIATPGQSEPGSNGNDRSLVIHLYLKIPDNFLGLILKEWFWFLHIPFGCIVQFYSCTISRDHLSHPVMPGLVFLCRIYLLSD